MGCQLIHQLLRLCEHTVSRGVRLTGQVRMHTLMDANSQGTLDDAQRPELEALVVQGQRLSVRKARTAALLTERGYSVTRAALSSANE